MKLFGEIKSFVRTENGEPIPVFVFETENFDVAKEALKTWYLSPTVINIPFLHSLPFKIVGIDPGAGFLRVEWVFEDFDPDHAYEMHLSKEQVQRLANANDIANAFRIILEEKKGRFRKKQTLRVSGKYPAYKLDWSGITGALFYIRNTMAPDRVKDWVYAVLPRIVDAIEAGEMAIATGLYTEIGYLYRLIEEWEKAANYYEKEIVLGMQPDGNLGKGCMKALCNLGVVYKKHRQYDTASNCFFLALHLNPNYFEVLISFAGIINKPQIALKCLARAYRIRPQNPYFYEAFDNVCNGLNLSKESAEKAIEQYMKEVEFSEPTPELAISEPNAYLQNLGIN